MSRPRVAFALMVLSTLCAAGAQSARAEVRSPQPDGPGNCLVIWANAHGYNPAAWICTPWDDSAVSIPSP